MAACDDVESVISCLGIDNNSVNNHETGMDELPSPSDVAFAATQQSCNSMEDRESDDQEVTGTKKSRGTDRNECRSLFQEINDSPIGQDQCNFTCHNPNFCRQTRASSAFLRSDIGTGVAVGCFYEIVHSELPRRPPIHLKNIRAVKVTEKSNHNITVRFPSAHSIRVYYQEEIRHRTLDHPSLDEQLIMSFGLALKVLGRRIPSAEAENRKRLKSFWVVSANPSIANPNLSFPAEQPSRVGTSVPYIGMMRWGMRRKVRYTNRHRGEFLSLIPYSARGAASSNGENRLVKRAAEISEIGRITKKVKFDRGRFRGFFNSKDRWSKERYEAAEAKLMEIMRETGAVISSPILRPDLRNEARKHVGDTGLLDHLLKHMAGKVASNGDRLCRRHNSNGAMEYWLEPAEFADLRKQAGVKDPAWVPPLGWKPGDHPYHDPEAARQLNELREDVDSLKKNMVLMLPAPTIKEEENACASTFKASREGDEDLNDSLEEKYKSLLAKQTLLEQLVLEMSSTLKAVQEEVGKWKRGADNEGKVEATEKSVTTPPPSSTQVSGPPRTSAAAVEKLARASCNQTYSRVRVRKSGFRICKPHGTFLWPNSSNSASSTPDNSQATVKHLDDIGVFMVPTPASSTSNANSVPSQALALTSPSPSSPVKPIPHHLFPSDSSYLLALKVKSCLMSEQTGAGSSIMSGNPMPSSNTWLALPFLAP